MEEHPGRGPELPTPPTLPTRRDPNALPSEPGDTFGIMTGSYLAWLRTRSQTPDTISMPSWQVSGSAAAQDGRAGESGARIPEGVPSESERPAVTYELRRMVGRGGNGEVWEAWQNALGRIVAVKQLRRDLVEEIQKTDPLAAPFLDIQFRQEAYTNAALEHPNILPVYDLGVDEKGRPLLAMKLVHGEPWDRVLRKDRGKLSEEELLAKHLPVLIGVAQAVAFAHFRGVIHRDLKPAQVMLGDFGEVLLMDWGLAVSFPVRTSNEECYFERTPITAPRAPEAANPAGTVSFMAPEQTDSSGEKVGPWTDVFLLGAILYYLLTETAPHLGASMEEMFARARAGVLDPPETRAPLRRIPPELSRLCMKAMAPRPEQRLASVEVFIEGLRAYLSGATRRAESEEIASAVVEQLGDGGKLNYEDLSAADAQLQRALALWPANEAARKSQQRVLDLFTRRAFLGRDLGLARTQAGRIEDGERRARWIGTILAEEERLARQDKQRKLAIGATAVVVVALLAVAFYASQVRQQRRVLLAQSEIQSLRAAEQERIAAAERERSELFQRVNQLREAEARLADRLTRVLPPPVSLFSEDQSGEALDEGALDELLREQQMLARRRADLAGAVPMEPPPFVLELAEAAAALYRARDREGMLAAYDLYERAALRRPEAPDPLTGMGIAAARAGELTSATLLLERAAESALELQGPNHPQYERAIALVAQSYLSNEQPAEVYDTYFRRSLGLLEPRWVNTTLILSDMWNLLGDIENPAVYSRPMVEVSRRVHGENSAEFARILSRAAVDRHLADEPEEAERHLRQALTIYASVTEGDWRYERSSILNDLSVVLHAQGRYRESLELLHEALELRTALLPESHPETASLKNNLAYALEALGDYAQAEVLYREALQLRLAALGEQSPQSSNTMSNLALLLQKKGELEEAKSLMERALASRIATHGENHPEVFSVLSNLGTLHESLGDLDSAEDFTRRSLESRRLQLGEMHRDTAMGWNNMGYMLARRGRLEEALEHYEHALRIRREVQGNDHVETAQNINNVAVTMFRLGRTAEAAALYEESLGIITHQLGDDHPETQKVITNLAAMYLRAKEFDRAEPMLLHVLKHRIERLGPEHPDTLSAFANLGALLDGMKEHALAEALIVMPLRTRRLRLDADHPSVIGLLESLAAVQYSLSAEDGEATTRMLGTMRELHRHYDARETMTQVQLRDDLLWVLDMTARGLERLGADRDLDLARLARQVAALVVWCEVPEDHVTRTDSLPRWSTRCGEDFLANARAVYSPAPGDQTREQWRAVLGDPVDWSSTMAELGRSFEDSQLGIEESRAIIRSKLIPRLERHAISPPEFP